MSEDPIVSALGRTALFRPLAREALAELARSFRERRFEGGAIVFSAGDPADALYVVRRGEVRLLRHEAAEGPRQVARLLPGDLFGELGLFEEGRRGETARAGDEGAVILTAAKPDLERVLADHPAVALKLYLAAAQGHSRNVERSLAMAARRAVRYTIHERAALETGEDRREVTVVDLSELGARLRGVPESWRPDSRVACRLVRGSESYAIEGRVAWLREGSAGIVFDRRAPEILESFRRAAAT